MIGRAPLAVVVHPVKGTCSRRAVAGHIRKLHLAGVRLELPIGTALHRVAFIREGCVEVRALRRERRAEEATHRGVAAPVAPNPERLARAYPTGDAAGIE